MKILKTLLLLSTLLLGAQSAFAASEGAASDGSFGSAALGLNRASTETRNLSVTQNGDLYVAFGTNRSSFSSVASIISTSGVNGGFFQGWASTNPNVMAVASASEPVIVTLPNFGQLSAERIRIYDCRGTTSAATTIFDKIITSTDATSAVVPFTHLASSGVTVIKSGTGGVTWLWRETKKNP